MNNLQIPASSSAPKNGLLRYQLLLVVLLPVLICYTLFTAIKYRSLRYFRQRLGMVPPAKQAVDIWIHAASVGEVSATLPLISAIRDKYPDKSILITTTTPTGATLFGKQNITNAFHLFLPLDYPQAISGFIKQCRPKCLFVMETEIWPNLFRICNQENIPICTVNGRLSQKTLDTSGWIRTLYQSTLQNSSFILTRSDNDTKAYIALGADSSKVKTIGNIKFSANVGTPNQYRAPINRPYVLAASTHNNEEFLIANFWKQRKLRQLSNSLLMIAPRHPNRLKNILGQLKNLQFNIAVRSKQEDITDSTDLYIVDTVGELIDFMADARVVFIGGSLVPVGGHNILEPAALGKPIIFGPHMENFADEAELLTHFNAAVQIEYKNGTTGKTPCRTTERYGISLRRSTGPIHQPHLINRSLITHNCV